MKIVRFLGGLGNQMFQYAFYLSLKEKFPVVKADVSKFESYSLHNGFELENIFNIKLPRADSFLIKLYDPCYRQWHMRKLRRLLHLKNAFYEQKEVFTFDDAIYTDKSPKLYWGYWQNEQYFRDVSDLIKQYFTFKEPTDQKNLQLLNRIKNENSIAIHIRRGDYLKDPLLGGICNLDYYHQAIDLISSKVNNPAFYIFSDDMEWSRENLTLPSATYVHGNKGRQSFIDMQLMSNCKHNIIANSSFSWWPAWLNRNEDKIIIAPRKWVNDPSWNIKEVTPPNWIRI